MDFFFQKGCFFKVAPILEKRYVSFSCTGPPPQDFLFSVKFCREEAALGKTVANSRKAEASWDVFGGALAAEGGFTQGCGLCHLCGSIIHKGGEGNVRMGSGLL